MKVRVVLSIEVDADAWREAYGNDQTAEDIRDAVRSSVAAAAGDPGVIASEGIIRNVEEKS